MERTAHGWTILDREAGVLSFEYPFAKNASAITFVARMANGQLLAVSPATGMDEAAFAELAQFGEVAVVVAPNGLHHLGVAEWRARFPTARFFASPETARRVAKKNPAAGSFEPLAAALPLTGPNIRIGEVENSRHGETWAAVKTEQGTIWFVSDILANLPRLPPNPFAGLLFRLTGSAPGFKVFHLALALLVKDKKSALRTLAREMRAAPPVMVVPSHGAPLAGPDVAAQTERLLAAYA